MYDPFALCAMSPPATILVAVVLVLALARIASRSARSQAFRDGPAGVGQTRGPMSHLPRAQMPPEASTVLRALTIQAAAVAAGAGPEELAAHASPEAACAIASECREAAERLAAERPERKGGLGAAVLSSLSIPLRDPTYVEARVVLVHPPSTAVLSHARVFGDQVWKAWLVPAATGGRCPHCGAPLPTTPSECAYCHVGFDEYVWRVLDVEAAAESKSSLVDALPDLIGRSARSVATRASRGIASGACVEDARIRALANEIERAVGKG